MMHQVLVDHVPKTRATAPPGYHRKCLIAPSNCLGRFHVVACLLAGHLQVWMLFPTPSSKNHFIIDLLLLKLKTGMFNPGMFNPGWPIWVSLFAIGRS